MVRRQENMQDVTVNQIYYFQETTFCVFDVHTREFS